MTVCNDFYVLNRFSENNNDHTVKYLEKKTILTQPKIIAKLKPLHN